ncbi:uncharacterized protein RAG0_13722 [Rhynchosporium agropyri]|uniref:Uncharacterized protein n=1 Tax=Rhynchosporium agropyri TaxID=914238 RepID=A0A1E1LDU9_9HELO|nr:uncharacterized protein RAG0_13722 [Rhynchosporium agropyri]
MYQALLAPSPWQKLPDALCSPKLRVTYISPLATYNSYKFQDGGETFALLTPKIFFQNSTLVLHRRNQSATHHGLNFQELAVPDEHRARNKELEIIASQLQGHLVKLGCLIGEEDRELGLIATKFKTKQTLIIAAAADANKIEAAIDHSIYGSQVGVEDGAIEAVKYRERMHKGKTVRQIVGLVSRRDRKMKNVSESYTEKINLCLTSALTTIPDLTLVRKQDYSDAGWVNDADLEPQLASTSRSPTNSENSVLLIVKDEEIAELKKKLNLRLTENVQELNNPHQCAVSSPALAASDSKGEMISALELELDGSKSELTVVRHEVEDLQAKLDTSQQARNKKTTGYNKLKAEVDEFREEKVYLEECGDFCEDVIAGWLEGGKERYVDGLFEFLPSRGLKNHYINGTRNDRVHGGNLKLVQTLLDLGRLNADGQRKELQYRFGCHPTDSITSVKEIEIRNLKATGINLFIGTKLSYLLSQKQNRCWLDIMNKFDAWKEEHRSNTFGVNFSLSKEAKLCDENPLVEKWLLDLRAIYNDAFKNYKTQSRLAHWS